MNETVVASAPNTAGKWAWICLAAAWLCFLLPVPGLGLLGWGLNLASFVLAIVAMSNRGAMAGLFQLLASLLVSPFVYLIGLILFVGTVGGTDFFSEMSESHGHYDSGSSHDNGNNAAEEANIAAIEAMADAASAAQPATVAAPSTTAAPASNATH